MGHYRDATVVITGASSGIGRELALQLAQQGARLVVSGRRIDRLQALGREVAELGGVALVAPCDVTDAQQVPSWAEAILRETGRVDILINNAGRGAYGPFVDVPLSMHDQVLSTNLRGVIHTTHALLPSMLAHGQGQLVFVSSVLGELPAPDHVVYGATKFAVNAFAESLRHELHGRGIDITVVAPGIVRSDFAATSNTPLHRFRRLPSLSSDQAARLAIRAMTRGQHLAVGDVASWIAIRARRLYPALFGWIYGRAFRRMRQHGSSANSEPASQE